MAFYSGVTESDIVADDPNKKDWSAKKIGLGIATGGGSLIYDPLGLGGDENKPVAPETTSYNPNNPQLGAAGGRQFAAEGRDYATSADRQTAFDASKQLESRNIQNRLLAQLELQAQGKGGPSQAEMVAQHQRDAGIRQAQALAASGRGVSPGAAQRQAQVAAGEAGIAGAQQATQIRAQEQAQAQGMLGQFAGATRGQDIGSAQAAAQTEIQNRATNDALIAKYLDAGMSMDQAQLQADTEMEKIRADQAKAAQQAEIDKYAIESGQYGDQQAGNQGLVGGALSALGSIFSDKKLKKNMKLEEQSIDEMLNNLSPYSFDYADESMGVGKHLGFQAQDMEKSDLGKLLVFETPVGKAVDSKKMQMAQMAILARLNERLNKLEGK